MTKFEKYWVFGMILILSVNTPEDPTLFSSIANVLLYLGGFGYFIAALWHSLKGEK